MLLYSSDGPATVLGVAAGLAASCFLLVSLMRASARDLSFDSLFNLATSNAELPFTAVGGGGGRSYDDLGFVVDVAKTDCTSAKGSLRDLLASSLRLDSLTRQVTMSKED